MYSIPIAFAYCDEQQSYSPLYHSGAVVPHVLASGAKEGSCTSKPLSCRRYQPALMVLSHFAAPAVTMAPLMFLHASFKIVKLVHGSRAVQHTQSQVDLSVSDGYVY